MKRVLSSVVALVVLGAILGTSAAFARGEATEKLKVRVITVTPITAGTWDPAHYRSYSAVAKKMGWDLQVAQAVAYGKASQVLSRWGDEKVDIVYSTDNGFQNFMLDAAKSYPDTLWVTMSDLSTTNGLKNVAAYTPNWCELGALQGAAAAAVTTTNKIGGVGAIPILPAKRLTTGAILGAKQVNPEATFTVKYSGDFIDAQKAQGVADALMEAGADVITPIAQAGISPQIAARVQGEGKLYIGEVADESRSAPRATVTSAILEFGRGYELVAKQRLDGTFTPGIHRGGIKEGLVRLLPFRSHKAAEAKVKRVADMLATGKLKLPKSCG